MNREIKYRYYSRYQSGGIAVDECTLEEIEDGYFKKPFLNGIIARVQYTGLKDKNGKEIYEGDILQSRSEIINVVDGMRRTDRYKTKVSFVEYRSDCGAFCLTENALRGISQDISSKFYAVIGNIYENPELLKGGE